MDHVVSVSGMSKGYGMPAIRVGFMAGHPALLRGAFLTKMEITKIHINYPGQYAALAAMRDPEYITTSTEIIRRNYAHIEETVARTPGVLIPVKPAYGFCMMIDVSGAGVTAQTQEILGEIDRLLAAAGTDKSRILTATIYLADIATFAEMNAAWDAWVAKDNPPARATVEAGELAVREEARGLIMPTAIWARWHR